MSSIYRPTPTQGVPLRPPNIYGNDSSTNGNSRQPRSRSPSPSRSPPRKLPSGYGAGTFARTGSGGHQLAQGVGVLPANLRHSHLCPHCEKDFPNMSSLNKHLTSHSQDRPHECIVCNKRFKRFDHLTSHMLTHRGEKPFQCPLETCQKRYSDQRSLKRHMEKNHGNYDYGHDLGIGRPRWAADDYDYRNHSQPGSPHDSPPLPPAPTIDRWDESQQYPQPGTYSPPPPHTHREPNDWQRAQREGQRGWDRDRDKERDREKERTKERDRDRERERLREREWERREWERMKEQELSNQSTPDTTPDPNRLNGEGKSEPRVGFEFQAPIPQLRDDTPPVARCQGELLWAASAVVEDRQVDDFIKFAGSLAAFGGGWTPEYALSVLHKHGGHIKTALGIILMPMKKNRRMERETLVRWSPAEKTAFEEAYRGVGKRFHLVQKYVRTKTTAQVIQYYYKWKKADEEKYRLYTAALNRPPGPIPLPPPPNHEVQGRPRGRSSAGEIHAPPGRQSPAPIPHHDSRRAHVPRPSSRPTTPTVNLLPPQPPRVTVNTAQPLPVPT